MLPPALEATEPPELTLGRRDAVRMMVSIGDDPPQSSTARDLSTWLHEGDLVVVNTSATIPAAVDATTPGGQPVVVHVSTELPTGLHLVEVRRTTPHGSTEPDPSDHAGEWLTLAGGGAMRILGRMPGSVRLWVATLDLPTPLLEHLQRFGRPIRYAYVPDSWPITAYTNSFARHPGSAEMPSAGRVADRRRDHRPRRQRHRGRPDRAAHRGRLAGGPRDAVPGALPGAGADGSPRQRHARRPVGGWWPSARRSCGRSRPRHPPTTGSSTPGEGWTELVITPSRGVHVVDGLLTGWHEPEASHLQMLEAVAGRRALELAYGAALAAGYRWHEFGDVHLILPERQ